MKTQIITLILIAMAITGCNSKKKDNSEAMENSDKEMASDSPITEKYWKLKTLEGQEVTMAENQEIEIFFTLKTDENRVTGFAGCNNLSGRYTLEDGNRIRFSNVAVTMKACPDVDVNEPQVLEVFNLADNYTIKGNTLSLNVGRRAPLAVFEVVYFE